MFETHMIGGGEGWRGTRLLNREELRMDKILTNPRNEDVIRSAEAFRTAMWISDRTDEEIVAAFLYRSLQEDPRETHEGEMSIMAGPSGWRITKDKKPIEKSEIATLGEEDTRSYQALRERICMRVIAQIERERRDIDIGLQEKLPDPNSVAREVAILERETRIGWMTDGETVRPSDSRSTDGSGSTHVGGVDARIFGQETKEHQHAERWSHVCDVRTIEQMQGSKAISSTNERLLQLSASLAVARQPSQERSART